MCCSYSYNNVPFFPVVQQTKSGLGRLFLRYPDHKYLDTHPVWPVWKNRRVISPSHRLLFTLHTKKHNRPYTHALSGILTYDPSNQAAAYIRLYRMAWRISKTGPTSSYNISQIVIPFGITYTYISTVFFLALSILDLRRSRHSTIILSNVCMI